MQFLVLVLVLGLGSAAVAVWKRRPVLRPPSLSHTWALTLTPTGLKVLATAARLHMILGLPHNPALPHSYAPSFLLDRRLIRPRRL